uniref:Uncharacterized protein n=1 Tax=Lepeophtheirus salmonis TaxID=72036 RepID=A0A0K2V2R1_LEPSM
MDHPVIRFPRNIPFITTLKVHWAVWKHTRGTSPSYHSRYISRKNGVSSFNTTSTIYMYNLLKVEFHYDQEQPS